MPRCRKKNCNLLSTTSGMTFLEVVLILMVLGILAITVAVRVNSGITDLIAATDSITSHLRLVQTLAMNSSQDLWGIQFDSDKYRIFKCEDGGDCDMEEFVLVPGIDSDANGWITLSDNDIQFNLKNKNEDNVAFDKYGVPCEIENKGADEIKKEFTLSLKDDSGNTRDIQITPKTGFIP